jgi:hypothetical protein
VSVPLVDFSTPDAPAFTYLGVTPTQITQPESARDLAVALASLVGTDGKYHQGVAIEWSPGRTFSVPTLASYSTFWGHLFYNTQFSIATSQGVGAGSGSGSAMGSASTETDGSIGLRMILWNPDDPIIALHGAAENRAKAAGQIQQLYFDVPPPACPRTWDQIFTDAKQGRGYDGNTVDGLKDAAEQYDRASKQLDSSNTALKKKWNATVVSVSAAIGAFSPDSKWKTGDWRGFAAWLTAAYGFPGTFAQLVFTARYHSDAHVATPGDTSLVGTRLILGNDSVQGFGEIAYNRLHSATSSIASDNWGQAATGVAFKVTGNTWLEIAFGGVFDKANEPNGFFAISNLKWNLGDKNLTSLATGTPSSAGGH